jgi:hypothetical protein
LELEIGGIEIEIKGWAGFATLVVIGLVVAAIVQELRLPSSQRTWHGRVGGLVPYDFRPPTMERLKAAMWNPDSDQIFTDRAFGVGWDVNLNAVGRKLG